MPIPSDGYPLTAAVSPRVQVVESTGSTNADVVAHVAAEPDAWPHLSLLLTTDQRRGRGRLDREWTAPAGTALAVSVVLRVGSIPGGSRGWLPLVAGTALARAVAAALADTGHTATVKWPNDVLVDGRKIAGILAEVVPGHLDAVVVGAGVNTRMPQADLPVPTATSFAVLGVDVDEDRLLADYLTELDGLVAALVAGRGNAAASGVQRQIEATCSTLGQDVRVEVPDGRQVVGRAQRLDAEGRLVVVDAGGIETVLSAGDVVHVR